MAVICYCFLPLEPLPVEDDREDAATNLGSTEEITVGTLKEVCKMLNEAFSKDGMFSTISSREECQWDVNTSKEEKFMIIFSLAPYKRKPRKHTDNKPTPDDPDESRVKHWILVHLPIAIPDATNTLHWYDSNMAYIREGSPFDWEESHWQNYIERVIGPHWCNVAPMLKKELKDKIIKVDIKQCCQQVDNYNCGRIAILIALSICQKWNSAKIIRENIVKYIALWLKQKFQNDGFRDRPAIFMSESLEEEAKEYKKLDLEMTPCSKCNLPIPVKCVSDQIRSDRINCDKCSGTNIDSLRKKVEHWELHPHVESTSEEQSKFESMAHATPETSDTKVVETNARPDILCKSCTSSTDGHDMKSEIYNISMRVSDGQSSGTVLDKVDPHDRQQLEFVLLDESKTEGGVDKGLQRGLPSPPCSP